MYDASNRKDIRKAEKDARQAEVNRLDYLKAAMSVAQGRAWFHELLAFCHCFDDPFTGNALHEAYRKGERNVGLRIFAEIVTHCPDDYVLMVKEENGRRTRNDSATRNPDLDNDDPTAERSSEQDDGRDVEGRSSADFDDIYNRALSE